MKNVIQTPLISVIITCFNQGKFLQDAIKSAIDLHYDNKEFIVIDDGSTDNTAEIARYFENVIYHYQKNQGLSAARNKGLYLSKGKYILFLDADDWLYPEGLRDSVSALELNETSAFISGSFLWINQDGTKGEGYPVDVKDPYLLLLERNYIGMHGTVLYRRSVLEKFSFDTSLKACEDYDLYLQIARTYQILHHNTFIAVYRKHDENMSQNFAMMLREVQKVLRKHKPDKNNSAAYTSWLKGKKYWKNYFLWNIIQADKKRAFSKEDWKSILVNPVTSISILVPVVILQFRSALKNNMPAFMLQFFRKDRLAGKKNPERNKVVKGDFNRVIPFDNNFGYNRGGPIDRVYIEKFLNEHATEISGKILEIGDNEYTLRFGGDRVTKTDILHIDQHNPKATYTGDLSNAPDLPDQYFDCIILTQTLHLIYDFKGALRTCRRILKPGGVLLLTVPGISPIDKGEWGANWYWSFTKQSIEKLSAEIFIADKKEINAYGNVFAATAFLYGMGAPELTEEQIFFYDPQYPVIITLKITRAVN